MLRASTNQSLLIIDEFGKGTMASNGMALLAATLMTLLEMKDKVSQLVHLAHLRNAVIDANGILCYSHV